VTSLYGGKPGLSFILRKPFKSIEEMENHFKKGDSYINVPLNEVVFFIRKNHIVPVVNACENTDSLDYSTISLLGDVNGTNSYLLYKDDGVTTEIDMTSNIVELK
jgi:alpha-glucosidase